MISTVLQRLETYVKYILNNLIHILLLKCADVAFTPAFRTVSEIFCSHNPPKVEGRGVITFQQLTLEIVKVFIGGTPKGLVLAEPRGKSLKK